MEERRNRLLFIEMMHFGKGKGIYAVEIAIGATHDCVLDAIHSLRVSRLS
jgi:hypothetical protein